MPKKPTLKGVAKQSVKGWGAVIAGGILLTVLALVDAPRDQVAGTDTAAGTSATATADGSTGCQLQVTAAELRVRSGPSANTDPLETLTQGQVVDGTTEVTSGFRRLEGNRWAADEFLIPVAGTSC
jgi:hypothetical protein